MIVTIRWNAVSTEVRINVKYHRGINQCHIASDKIIEVRSNGRKVRCNGMKVRSNGMEVRSNGMEVRSNGMEVRSNGRKVRSNGTRIRSNGMQVAIRLHFCPECPSIRSAMAPIWNPQDEQPLISISAAWNRVLAYGI